MMEINESCVMEFHVNQSITMKKAIRRLNEQECRNAEMQKCGEPKCTVLINLRSETAQNRPAKSSISWNDIR
jgi:uncharacterized pyridoxal phosphate-containing UPF0001 family protein